MNAAATADDTIVAVATPPGRGGIGIVRLSGGLAEDIARRLLSGLPQPRVATHTKFLDPSGAQIDAGIALYFPGPTSFTGESVIELHGHGGPTVMAMLVDAAIELGARRAEPGEFSRRAFLNHKLDLAQAEAIADLIASGTEQAARAALRSLSGAFSEAVNTQNERLTALRTYVEAAIDFPEEEIDFLADDELATRLDECGQAFVTLLASASIGRVLRDGYQVVIVGKPNAGKSSLMNRLSGEDTAIVTEVAGTTRDVLRERINIQGLAVELVDTAGLRNDPDRIEEEGIRRARTAMANADAVLWIQDATGNADETIDEELPQGIPVTIVRNKIDLTGEAAGIEGDDLPLVCLSAKTGDGLDALRQRISDLAGFRDLGEGAFTARRRHVEALKNAAQHFEAGRTALRESRAGELLAEELRLAQQALGAITGIVTSDELLGRIFSEFCIGK
jgi:tRNA modification GTPase